MSPPADITGQRFGRLTVLRIGARSPSGDNRWLCVCDCGRETLALVGNLRAGHKKSCGCHRSERGRPWTEADLTYLRSSHATTLDRDIAAHLGRTTRAITLKAAQDGLTSLIRERKCWPTEAVYVAAIKDVAAAHEMSPIPLLSASSHWRIARIRWEAWQRLRNDGYGVVGIGAISGYDHSSIAHGTRRLAEMRAAQ